MSFLVAAALAGELSGVVTGADGAPVVGATVLAYDSRFNYGQAVSRSGGEWSIVGLPADRYRVRVLAPNADPHGDRYFGGAWDTCAAEVVALGDDTTVDTVDQTLETGAAVTGRIVDTEGLGVPGARVSVYGAEPRVSLVLRDDLTDDDGRFSVVGLDAETTGNAFYLRVDVEGWPTQFAGPAYVEGESTRTALGAGTTVDLGDLVLLDGISLRGTVTGPVGPVASGSLFAYSSQQVLSVAIGADGRYIADGLPPGEVVIWASSPGLATTYYPDDDRPGGSFTVGGEGEFATQDLDLPGESTLTLHATGEGTLDEVSVLVYNDTYTVGRGDGLDDAGDVTIPGLWPGDYFVYVYGRDGGFTSGYVAGDDGEPRVFQVSGATEADLELHAGATLSGTITGEDGEPVYGASVTVTDSQDTERTWTATTGRDGTYAVPGVPGATVNVGGAYYWYCPSDPGFAPMWVEGARSRTAGATLLVTAGEPLAGLDLVLPTDNDHDAMGDTWERENGLDPTRDDGAADPDLDGYTNAEEWVLGTDPNDTGAVAAGCAGCAGAGGVSGSWAVVGGMLGLWRRRAGAVDRSP